MLKTGMYVRCSIDTEDPNEPRDFISGKILEINEFAETAKVMFYDILGLRKYYQVSQTLEFPLSKLCHCKSTMDLLPNIMRTLSCYSIHQR